ERHEYPTGAPLYIWHTVPEHLGTDEKKRLATRTPGTAADTEPDGRPYTPRRALTSAKYGMCR
ncbi:hypothetical protein ABZ421_34290, partial [Streptomyces sp. NPDC005859]